MVLYLQCSFCKGIGTREYTKIRCKCCKQLTVDKNEMFQCRSCGGPMVNIGSDKFHRFYYRMKEKGELVEA